LERIIQASSNEGDRTGAAVLPQWIKPQLTQLVDQAPDGPDWLHEIKFDGYRMHARLDRGAVRLLTRTGLDWTHKYPAIAAAVSSIGARQAYLDGELCGVGPDGITSFSMIQLASDSGNAAALVFFLFDLLYLDGEDLCPWPLIERKARLAELLSNATSPLHYCDHQIGHGREFHDKACAMGLERLWRRLQPLAIDKMPLDVPPPRGSRFGSPLVLSRVHWVRPELVAEVKYLAWTDDNLLRQVVYEGLREDKPAAEVRREDAQMYRCGGGSSALPRAGSTVCCATRPASPARRRWRRKPRRGWWR
jgi:ATP-dependent DNA ligase